MNIELEKAVANTLIEQNFLQGYLKDKLHLYNQLNYVFAEDTATIQYITDSVRGREEEKDLVVVKKKIYQRISKIDLGLAIITFYGSKAKELAEKLYSQIKQKLSLGWIQKNATVDTYKTQINIKDVVGNVNASYYIGGGTRRTSYSLSINFNYEQYKREEVRGDILTKLTTQIKV